MGQEYTECAFGTETENAILRYAMRFRGAPQPHKLTKPTKTTLPHKSQKADRLTSANPQTKD